MQETSFMAEALLPLHLHWYLSYALVVVGLFLIGVFSKPFLKRLPQLLVGLNGSLLVILLLAGAINVVVFVIGLFGEPVGIWSGGMIPSLWNTYLGEFYLLLYHNIGTWVGLLLFWGHFRKSFFLTGLLAVLVNVHTLVDASLAVDWWRTDWRLGYELATFSAIRMEPTILIREWSLLWIVVGILMQIAILGGYHRYTTNQRST